MANWVRVEPARKVNGMIANDPAVKAIVDGVADEIGAKAQGNLEMHRLTGHSYIEVEHKIPNEDYGDIDSVVWLVDENGDALAIEFGHSTKNGKWVEGKYILGSAAGIV